MDIINLIAEFSPYYYFEHQRKMETTLHYVKCFNWDNFYYLQNHKCIVSTYECIVCKRIFLMRCDRDMCLRCTVFLKHGYEDNIPF